MKSYTKLMKSIAKLFLVAMLFLLIPMKHIGQTPYRPYADDGISLNFFNIDNVDFRLFLLYNLSHDDNFVLIPEDENGLFVVNPSTDRPENDFFEAFESFYNNTLAEFSLLTKHEIYDLLPVWKSSVSPIAFTSITMDIALNRSTRLNNHCVDSDPFCTSDVITFDAASSSQTADDLEGAYFDDGCIGNSYNPSWYHMRINTPGQFIIHMEGHDPNNYTNRDIDFCMWGPFDDPTAPCVAQLTTNKIIDCNYSSSYSEDIYLGYAEYEHQHQADHGTINEHMPETGEYFILMITNYSQQPCTISFTKTEGSGPGTTDCGILPGIAANDGPYCVGETIHLTVTTQAGATYTWTGPDGFQSNQQNPVIPNCTLEMAGTYTCVTAVDGQTTTGSTEVVIYPSPIADFSFTSTCEGEATNFTSTSTTDPLGQDIESYTWEFGDGETATGPTTSHTYASAGTYEVVHSVSNGSGLCVDQITKTVTVHAMPIPVASANPVVVQYGGVATLTAEPGVEGSFSYHWEPANMVVSPNSQTTQTVPLTETQVFTVTITNNEGGCTSSTQITVVMAGSDLTATATADQYEICEDESTTLHALPLAGTGQYTYSWSPANSLNNPTIQHPVASPEVGTTTYTCHVSDGIVDTDVSVTITVHPKEASEFSQSICEGSSYNFFGQNLSVAGNYQHMLHTIHGCDSLITLHLSINPIQEYAFEVENGHCDSYFWDPQGHEIVFTDHEGSDYTESGTYHRTYSDVHGCDSLVTMSVKLDYTPVPNDIYPMDPDNSTPHWVVTATEFQINSYDFHLWDTNPNCYWDTVTWSCDEAPDWILEPFGEKGKCCKVYVLEHIDDTIWLRAHAFNHCAPEEGIEQRYWLICSFYGIDDHGSSTSSGTVKFNVMPNPNNGQMSLYIESLPGLINIKVYDMRGTLIDSFDAHNENGSGTYAYTMKKRTDGIYYFVATCKEGTVTKKVVIQP